MKIALLGGEPLYLLRFRGHLLATLKQRGHDVVALAGAHDAEVERELHASGIPFRAFPFHRTGTHPLQELRSLRSLIALLKDEQPNLVIANTLKLITYTAIAARRAKIPRFAALLTGLGTPFAAPHGPYSHLLHRGARILLKLGLEQASTLLLHNPEDLDTLRAFGLIRPDQHAAVVDGSGVDVHHFTASPLPTQPVNFLFMGRLLRSKGVLDFIAASIQVKSRVPSARFQLLGDLDASHPHSIGPAQLERAQRSGIEYLGQQRDVRPYLHNASALVVPSHDREGLPRTILEAFACGRPVIASDIPGCRHVVTPHQTGWLVPPQSPDALATLMTELARDPTAATTLSPQCRALAERRFAVERVTQQFIDALQI